MSAPGASRPLWRPSDRAARTDVLGVGENSLDTVCVVDALPRSGRNLEARRIHHAPGGQIATAVLGCARLGLRAAYAGRVGDDAAAGAVLAPLEAAGVDLDGVERVPGAATRSAVILVESARGERSVIGHRDPRLALRPECVSRDRIRDARLVLLDAEDPEASTWIARIARAEGIPVVLDADRVLPGVDALLEQVDFPLVSRSFADEWGRTGSLRRDLEALACRGARLAV